ncbi:tetratricopeptide repeat protein [Krasilnikovia sp. MM14-A1259]|uniref:tetratricopeptide repeat protein n=1 Tax=Krasilnikovia sp. MM14-A1259 TaxID=3373539 RepID=UPI00380ADBB6
MNSDDQTRQPPAPGRPHSVDEFAGALKALWAWADMPSYRVLAKRISADAEGTAVSHSTVADIFKPGRRRLDIDLVVRLVRALGLTPAQVIVWRDACVTAHAATQRAESVEALRQLPHELAAFVGRDRELAELRRAIAESGDTAGPCVVAVEGMAGIGKTQFAIHAAHELVRAGHYADVQLFTNLRGFDRQRAPIDPSEVLDSFLRRLGVPGSRIPADLDGRAAMYRDRLDGRAAIVVLDNVVDEDQVRDLLPTGPRSLTIMTSRRSLAGLAHVRQLVLPAFSPDEALELLHAAASADKVNADRRATIEIAELCGHLPIAVALASQRLRARSSWTVRNLADYLRTHGLDGLSAGGSTVRAVFELSYRELDAEQGRHYRLLALHPGDALTPGSVAAITGLAPAAAQAFLESMLDQNLLQQRGSNAYEFHDLLRAFARGLVLEEEDEATRQAALRRVFDHYLATATAAIRELYPYRGIPDRATGRAEYFPHPDARTWLTEESPSLLAVARSAGPRYTVEMAGILSQHLQAGGHFGVNEQLQLAAAAAAGELGDLAGRYTALLNLGTNYAWTSLHADALRCLAEALDGFRALGDRRAEAEVLSTIGLSYDMSSELLAGVSHYTAALAILDDDAGAGRVMGNLGFACERLGRYEESLVWSQRAVQRLEAINAQVAVGRVLTNLGRTLAWTGRIEEATGKLEQALTLSRSTGDRTGEGAALMGLAFVHARAGRPSRGIPLCQQALEIFDSTGNRADECRAMSRIGTCLLELGEITEALAVLTQALDNSRVIADRVLQAQVLNSMGAALLRSGDPEPALECHREAAELTAMTGDRYEAARAQRYLGETFTDLGDLVTAREHLERAVQEFQALGQPEAAIAQAALGRLGPALPGRPVRLPGRPGLVPASPWGGDPDRP